MDHIGVAEPEQTGEIEDLIHEAPNVRYALYETQCYGQARVDWDQVDLIPFPPEPFGEN